mmetsp:Transcript_71114/g.140988  ORF Transcript_71114/g.140988 Transcript_71114/m.140988 type:complete len:219 (+) Transcript_71114:1139-1795(+)
MVLCRHVHRHCHTRLCRHARRCGQGADSLLAPWRWWRQPGRGWGRRMLIRTASFGIYMLSCSIGGLRILGFVSTAADAMALLMKITTGNAVDHKLVITPETAVLDHTLTAKGAAANRNPVAEDQRGDAGGNMRFGAASIARLLRALLRVVAHVTQVAAHVGSGSRDLEASLFRSRGDDLLRHLRNCRCCRPISTDRSCLCCLLEDGAHDEVGVFTVAS